MTIPQVQTGPRGLRLEKLFLALWYLEIKYHRLKPQGVFDWMSRDTVFIVSLSWALFIHSSF